MEYDCESVQNLIPLVKKGIASEADRTIVIKHIKECSVCREKYEIDAQSIFVEISKATQYKINTKKHRILINSSIALLFIIFVAGIGLSLASMIRGFIGESYSTRNIAEYGNYSGHIKGEENGFFTSLKIFPKELLPSATVEDYYYFCNNGALDNSYQIYYGQIIGIDESIIPPKYRLPGFQWLQDVQ
ncbi:MAG: hypothetical protein FWC47_07065 [Oscillospiraceae bacterium]|nr:hypothetical protein [Oscillospiraceae bacterium]